MDEQINKRDVLTLAEKREQVSKGSPLLVRYKNPTRSEKKRLIKSVWAYLSRNATAAFEVKDGQEFDWYSNGLECFFQCLTDNQIKITQRIRIL